MRTRIVGILVCAAVGLLAADVHAQLGAIGGIASIQGQKQTTFPLFTLTAKSGKANILDTGVYLYYAQADRYMGKDIYTVFSGNPRERLVYKIFNVSYNLTSDMNLSLSIPYVSYDWGQIITDSTFGIVRSGGGLSNPAVRFMYQFLRSPMLAVYGTVYLPTGFLQVGSEGTDLEADVAYTDDLGIVQWDSNVGYRLTGKQPSTNVKPNDIIIANTAFSIPFGLLLSGFFEINVMNEGQLTDLNFGGSKQSYTVQQWKVDLVPGIRLSVTPSLFLTVAMKYSAYNTFQLGYHYIYTMGLDYLVL